MQRLRETEATPKREQAVTGGSAVLPENQAHKQKEGLNPDRDLGLSPQACLYRFRVLLRINELICYCSQCCINTS